MVEIEIKIVYGFNFKQGNIPMKKIQKYTFLVCSATRTTISRPFKKSEILPPLNFLTYITTRAPQIIKRETLDWYVKIDCLIIKSYCFWILNVHYWIRARDAIPPYSSISKTKCHVEAIYRKRTDKKKKNWKRERENIYTWRTPPIAKGGSGESVYTLKIYINRIHRFPQ